jgi:hypothetical protein
MGMLKLDLRIYQPTVSAARMQALWGNLWENGKEGATATRCSPRSSR